MPRTMTSTASGKPSRNRAKRRFLRKDNSHSGRPQPAAKAAPSAANRPAPAASTAKNATKPSTPAVRKNRRFDQVEPGLRNARGQRQTLGLLLPLFDLLERALHLFAARPLRRARRPRRHRLRPRDACHAPFRVPFAGQQRINEDPGDSADRQRHQSEDEVHVHLIDSRAVCSAASSAAASRCSSP